MDNPSFDENTDGDTGGETKASIEQTDEMMEALRRAEAWAEEEDYPYGYDRGIAVLKRVNRLLSGNSFVATFNSNGFYWCQRCPRDDGLFDTTAVYIRGAGPYCPKHGVEVLRQWAARGYGPGEGPTPDTGGVPMTDDGYPLHEFD